jgi:hypothetical protein
MRRRRSGAVDLMSALPSTHERQVLRAQASRDDATMRREQQVFFFGKTKNDALNWVAIVKSFAKLRNVTEVHRCTIYLPTSIDASLFARDERPVLVDDLSLLGIRMPSNVQADSRLARRMGGFGLGAA